MVQPNITGRPPLGPTCRHFRFDLCDLRRETPKKTPKRRSHGKLVDHGLNPPVGEKTPFFFIINRTVYLKEMVILSFVQWISVADATHGDWLMQIVVDAQGRQGDTAVTCLMFHG